MISFIASYWWLWLIGVIVCAAFGVFKWGMGFLKTAFLVHRVAKLSKESYDIATDSEKNLSDKATHVKDRALQETLNEGVGRVKDVGFLVAGVIFAAIFTILLIISIVINLIGYV